MGRDMHTAREMIAFGRKAAAAGVDAMQVYSIDMGHGVLPSARELEAFYRAALEAVENPIVLATHEPAGYKPSLDLLSRLVADYDHIIGINCTHADLDYLVRVIDALDPRMEVHIGATQQAFACLALGGTGFMGPLSAGLELSTFCMAAIQPVYLSVCGSASVTENHTQNRALRDSPLCGSLDQLDPEL